MFKSLSARAAILTGTVAAIAVVIAGLVALPMIRGAAEIQAQVNLSAQADLVRDIAVAPEDFNLNNNGNRPGVDARAFSGIISYLNAQGVEVLTLVPGTSEPKILTADQKDVIESGRDVSARNCVGDECFLIEGRPLGVGTGVILTQSTQVVTEVTTSAIRRIAIALVVGLGVAIFIGFLAARRLSRPLREAAAGARELALGKRDLRLTPEGPTEISEIAHALNLLAEGLTRSEGRQREFLLSVSHELRTPLTAIRGYAEAMADGLVVESRRFHRFAGEGCRRVLHRVRTGKAAADKGEGQDREEDLRAGVEVVAHVGGEVGAGHVFADRGGDAFDHRGNQILDVLLGELFKLDQTYPL